MIKLGNAVFDLPEHYRKRDLTLVISNHPYMGIKTDEGYLPSTQVNLVHYLADEFNRDYNLFFNYLRENSANIGFYLNRKDYLVLHGILFTIWFPKYKEEDILAYLDNIKEEDKELLVEETISTVLIREIEEGAKKIDLTEENRKFILENLPLEIYLLLKTKYPQLENTLFNAKINHLLFQFYLDKVIKPARIVLLFSHIIHPEGMMHYPFLELKNVLEDITLSRTLRNILVSTREIDLKRNWSVTNRVLSSLLKDYDTDAYKLIPLIFKQFNYGSLVELLRNHPVDLEPDYPVLFKLFENKIKGKKINLNWLQGVNDVLLK